MARDPKIHMRDGLAIPGFLLLFYGLVAIIYAEQFRARSDFCPESSRVLIAGLCYSVWKLIFPIVLIGLALFITGLTAFRARPTELEGHLRHGTPSHIMLAFLISLVMLPAVAWVVQTVRQGDGAPFELTILGARYEHTFLLELVVLLGLLMLVPYLSLYMAVNVRRRRFLEAADEALDEDVPLPHDQGFAWEDTTRASDAQAREMLPEDAWPSARDNEGAVIACLAKVDGRTCPQPTMPGQRYCILHACKGTTRDGAPCGNLAVKDGLCRVHASGPGGSDGPPRAPPGAASRPGSPPTQPGAPRPGGPGGGSPPPAGRPSDESP